MDKKTIVANEITRFFRFFRISIPIGIGVMVILFLLVFEGYKTFHPDYSNTNYVPSTSMYESGRIVYGNSFNRKAIYFYKGDFYSINFNSTQGLKNEIERAIKYYQEEKIKTSILFGVIAIFGLPILLILIRQTSSSVKSGKEWLDKNKTI